MQTHLSVIYDGSDSCSSTAIAVTESAEERNSVALTPNLIQYLSIAVLQLISQIRALSSALSLQPRTSKTIHYLSETQSCALMSLTIFYLFTRLSISVLYN